MVCGGVIFAWVMAGPLLTYVSADHLARPANAPVTCNGHEMHTDEICKVSGKQIVWRTYDEMKAAETRHPTWDVTCLVVGSVVTIGGIALAWYVVGRRDTSADQT
jgi:hypothetical protein